MILISFFLFKKETKKKKKKKAKASLFFADVAEQVKSLSQNNFFLRNR